MTNQESELNRSWKEGFAEGMIVVLIIDVLICASIFALTTGCWGICR